MPNAPVNKIRNHILIAKFGLICLVIILAFSGCTKPPVRIPEMGTQYVFAADGVSQAEIHAPLFVIENPEKLFNLIGTPTVERGDNGEEHISIDPSVATIYSESRPFKTSKAEYLNLIYRIHFKEVPSPHLGQGNNVGLIVVVTLNLAGEPVLVTTVHTCGCYLAFISTSFLNDDALPEGWDRHARQNIYGESLPKNLEMERDGKLMLLIENETHRVRNIWDQTVDQLTGLVPRSMSFAPLASLKNLPLGNGETTSFFETEGNREGLVKGSYKPLERLMISWWALDWHVGEDKRLGVNTKDGRPFYTSLKPWARQSSDMRNFPTFLEFWGWRL